MAIRPRPRSFAAVGVAAAAALALGLPAPASVSAGVQSVRAPGAEDSNQFAVVPLVADRPGQAESTDPDLVNAWGLAFSPTSPLWVANNGTDTSTLYSGATGPGQPVTKVPLTVNIPGGGAPTGMVFNPTSDFQLSSDGKSGPALFIFAGEDGDVSAWNQTGDTSQATLVAHHDGAVYKGMAITQMGGKPFLLVADFHDNRVDIYNRHFDRVERPGAFSSRNIPDGYGVFNVANLGGRVYVTYAKQDAKAEDDVKGPGFGFVNVFSRQGRFLATLVRRGVLNAPWGLAIAPAGFGPYAGKLLVGNFGNGRIHVVDQRTGDVLATLRDTNGKPIAIDGLWALLPGNGTAGGRSDVWFSAGPNDEAHGLLGILRHE